MRFRSTVICALLVFFAALAHAEEWILTFDTTEVATVTNQDGAIAPKTETRRFTQTVVLTPETLSVKDDRRQRLYEFDRKRLVTLDLARNTYDDGSLFGVVDFLQAELANRNALGAAMRSARVDPLAKQFDRFDSETTLRVLSRPHPAHQPAPEIEQLKLADGAVEFRRNGELAVRFVPSEVSLPIELKHRFVNYLAYSCAIHPDIRRTIAASGVVPHELIFTWRNMNRVTTTTLRLTGTQKTDTDAATLPNGAQPDQPADSDISQLLEKVAAAGRNTARPSRAETVAFADSRIQAGHVLDGLMALLEHGLQSGEQLSNDMRRHRQKFAEDERSKLYLQAFDQSSQAACERSLMINASIDRTDLTRVHMLHLQRANHLDRLGKPNEAQHAYIEVINANPLHAGALHDLGMLLTKIYEHPNAWACWDAARELYLNHPMFSDVVAREKTLVADLPDFF